jgi:type I restriction enzyme R subunit
MRARICVVNHIASIAKENDVVMAQVENATKEQVLKGNLPGAVQNGVVRAMASHNRLSVQVLKEDKQAMSALTDLIYELLKSKRSIDFEK